MCCSWTRLPLSKVEWSAEAAEPSNATPEILVKNGDQGGCSGRNKQHTTPPAKDKESTRIWTCCLTSHTWPPAKKKATSRKSYSNQILLQSQDLWWEKRSLPLPCRTPYRSSEGGKDNRRYNYQCQTIITLGWNTFLFLRLFHNWEMNILAFLC